MSQAVRELQPFGAPMTKNAFETQPSTRSGVTVLEPAVAPRPYHASPQVKVASQPVPQLTKIASTPAPTSATHGDSPMTQLNQAKLASGIGVLDTLAGRQIDAATYIKQASASNHPALQASADDAYYALKVAQVAPDVFNRACEMVYGVQKQASRADVVGSMSDAARSAAKGMKLDNAPGMYTDLSEGALTNYRFPDGGSRSLQGSVSASPTPPPYTQAMQDSFRAAPTPPPYTQAMQDSFRADQTHGPSSLIAPGGAGPVSFVPSNAQGPFSPVGNRGYALNYTRDDVPLGSRAQAAAGYAAQTARNNPIAATGVALGGAAALGGGGYAAYEGLRDRPWYEQLGNAVGM